MFILHIREDSESLKVRIMLDSVEYKIKPNGNDIRYINNRIMNCATEISSRQLANEIILGKSFCPAYMGGVVSLNDQGNPRRSINNWTSQQVICLDFDNVTNKKKDVRMTVEEAIEEFKHTASFLYTSFSHTDDHPKFRVVFFLDKPIEDYEQYEIVIDALLVKYPHADHSCRDGSRIFYGGKQVIELNYDNMITYSVSSDETRRNEDELKTVIIKGKNQNKGGFCVSVRRRTKKLILTETTKPPSERVNDRVSKVYDNIEIIKNKEIKKIQEIMEVENEVVFHTYDEVYRYLKSQDLNKFLGLYGNKFICPFHEDSEPSASIYIHEDSGDVMYKCFSESCKFKSGTIMKCVEKIQGCNRVEGIRFLRKVFKINYYETEWQREQREIIDENIRYIRSDDFCYEYPIQYKLIKPYLDDLHTFLTLAKDNLPPEHYSEEQKMPIFYTTLKQFAKLRGYKDHRRLTDRLALFAFLCYTCKLNEDQIPNKLLQQARKELMKNKGKRKVMNLSSFFSIPSYSESIMSAAEEYAEKFYNHSLTMSNWNWEMLYRTFGKEEADRVYPQLSRKSISEISHEHVSRLESEIMSKVEKFGYVTEDTVIENVEFVFGKNTYKKRQLKIALGEIIEKYGLERVRLNKELKNKYEFKGKGYPFIIVKGSELN